jgi:hypothetical protein
MEEPMNDRTYARKVSARRARYAHDWREDYARRIHRRSSARGVQPARGAAALSVLAPNTCLRFPRSTPEGV